MLYFVAVSVMKVKHDLGGVVGSAFGAGRLEGCFVCLRNGDGFAGW